MHLGEGFSGVGSCGFCSAALGVLTLLGQKRIGSALAVTGRAGPCLQAAFAEVSSQSSSVAALPAVLDTLAALSLWGWRWVVFCLVVSFFPKLLWLLARVHLGISLLLNELLVREGGSEVPAGWGGWGQVLLQRHSTLNRQRQPQNAPHGAFPWHPASLEGDCSQLAAALVPLLWQLRLRGLFLDYGYKKPHLKKRTINRNNS